MKRIKLVAAILVSGIFMVCGQAIAAKSSMEAGEKLFGEPTLGGSANAKSCNNCHAGGKGLTNVAGNKKLVKLMNRCITSHLEGEKIDGRSTEMRSLKMYIQSLAGN